MNNQYSDSLNKNQLKYIKEFFYKLLIGEVFLKQFKNDTRSRIARILDLFIPVFFINIILFLIIFSSINSIIFSVLLSSFITIAFYRISKIVKSIINYYLQDIYQLKEKANKIYNYINNLNNQELENLSKELINLKIESKNSTGIKSLSNMRNYKLKFIPSELNKDEELTIITNFKNDLLSSNIYNGIVVLKNPAKRELLNLAKQYRRKLILNLIILDINDLINLLLTQETKIDLDNSTLIEDKNKQYSLNTLNQQLLYYKKKFIGHIAVAVLLYVIGLLLETFGTIYVVLSFFNILLALISFYKYSSVLNVLIPGNIEKKLIDIV